MKEQIMSILELGLKNDGKSFYSNKDKCELLCLLFDEELRKTFDKGWIVGYTKGERDDKIPSSW